MSWRKQVGISVGLVALVLAVPSTARAQGGFWEYIFRLSGPSYEKAFSTRVSACLTEPWCLESAVGPLRFEGTRESKAIEPQVGFALTYGWDGDNDDKLIADTSMLVLEPHARLLAHDVPRYLPRIFTAGLGFHRFSGGTVPEDFWRTAVVWSLAWRLDAHEILRDRARSNPTWFLESGVKFRTFFDRLRPRDFGGLPNDQDTEATGWGLFFGGGLRWDFDR